MVVKALVFDSDGVINPFPNKKFSDRFKDEFPDELGVMDFFKNGVYGKCRRGELCVKEEFPKFLDGTQWTLDSILKYWHEGDNGVDTKIINIIKKLRKDGFCVYLATNQANCRTEYMVNEMGLNTGIFNRIIASCDPSIMVEKPELKFYEKLFDIIKNDNNSIKPEEILFFDDKIENVVTAEQFGFQSYHYIGFEQFLEIINTHNINILHI